jgi:biotin transport system substrate-specific component
MLRTLNRTRDLSLTQRLMLISVFVGLTALSAQFEFGGPVPYTLQVLVVLLSGMVLGARDGALTQIAYAGLIWFNLPIAAGGAGAAALTGATAGYLIAFIPAAWVTGFLVEHGADRVWQRLLAGLVGVAMIYALGFVVFKAVSGLGWAESWSLSVQPFIAFDFVKALVAAGLAESGRTLIQQYFPPLEDETR